MGEQMPEGGTEVKPLAVCVVGTGRFATRRIYPYVASAGGKLVGVCSRTTAHSEEKTTLYGGTPYTDLDAMLDAERPDCVIVCVGPAAHAELARRIMARGVPVYTEKPPALSLAQAVEVARTAAETGVLCTTAFKKRYSHAYCRAKEWIDGFGTQELLSISVTYASGAYGNKSEERSLLMDFAIHCIDLIAYLFGDAESVFAVASGRNAYAVSIRFAGGAVGSFHVNDGRSFTVPTEEVEITAGGGNFMSISNSSRWRIVRDGVPAEWREPPTFTSRGDSGNDTGHLAEIADFFAAVREERSTRSDIFASCRSMALYDAIRRSAEGSEVTSPEYGSIPSVTDYPRPLEEE
jgi:predicted dehydrogenase